MPLVGADGSVTMVQQPPAALLDSCLVRRPDVGPVTQSSKQTGDDSLASTDDQSLTERGVVPETIRDIPLVAREPFRGQLAFAAHGQTSGRRERDRKSVV